MRCNAVSRSKEQSLHALQQLYDDAHQRSIEHKQKISDMRVEHEAERASMNERVKKLTTYDPSTATCVTQHQPSLHTSALTDLSPFVQGR